MKYFQAKNSAPRTVFNRTQSLGTFLNAVKHHVDFKFTKKKRGGDIPNYTDPPVNYRKSRTVTGCLAVQIRRCASALCDRECSWERGMEHSVEDGVVEERAYH